MEIIEIIVSIIKDVGFPIAMCVALLYDNQKMRTEHKEEVGKLTTALDNNTQVMTEVVTILTEFKS